MCGTSKGREKKVLEKELGCPVRHKRKQVICGDMVLQIEELLTTTSMMSCSFTLTFPSLPRRKFSPPIFTNGANLKDNDLNLANFKPVQCTETKSGT